ncbi:hypothetical protein [Vulgatibacter sp.]|uniref:hypothetical protein n=1 Tax=Vulgatibacter sp. TaxID=1971226 RepID=UPI0035654C50
MSLSRVNTRLSVSLGLLLVNAACINDEPPARCGRSGTVRLATSAFLSVELELSRDFVYALQGAYREDGAPYMSVARYSVDDLSVERFVPESGTVTEITSSGSGLYFNVGDRIWGDQPRDGGPRPIVGQWSEVWYWPDGGKPSRLSEQDWLIFSLEAWGDGVLAQYLRDDDTVIASLSREGTWTEFHAFPETKADVNMLGDGEQLYVYLQSWGRDALYRFDRKGKVLDLHEAVSTNPELKAQSIFSVDGYLYVDLRGPIRTDLYIPAYGDLLEIAPDGTATTLVGWENRGRASLAADSSTVFYAMQPAVEKEPADAGQIRMQVRRGEELQVFREGLVGPTALAADDWRLVVEQPSAEEQRVYHLDLTMRRTGSEVPGCG